MGQKVEDIVGLSELKESKAPLLRALIAELIGTGLLVFVGCGAATTGLTGYLPGRPLDSAFITQVSLAFGLVVAAVAQAIGHVSGGHINPAVTLGIMVTGQMSILRGVLYMLVQYLGAIGGAGLLSLARSNSQLNDGLGANALQSGVGVGQGVLVEAIGTFILVIVVFGCCDSRRDDVKGSVPLAIGLACGLSHILCIGFTGTGINPARSLGPAVWKGDFTNLWVYFVGPYIGGAVAGLLYTTVFKARGTSDSVDFE